MRVFPPPCPPSDRNWIGIPVGPGWRNAPRPCLASDSPQPARKRMDWRNRTGLYGSYFLGMAAIGFTLPYLSLYLGEKGLSDRAIGIVSTLAAISGLAQFPIGLWSDRIGWRKPFLIVALTVAALSTVLLRSAQGVVWLGFVVMLFAENGICRAVVEKSVRCRGGGSGCRRRCGRRPGSPPALKPIGIISVALAGSWISSAHGVGAILLPLAVIQTLATGLAFLIHQPERSGAAAGYVTTNKAAARSPGSPRAEGTEIVGCRSDAGLSAFVAAMILYHMANARGRLPGAFRSNATCTPRIASSLMRSR